MTQHDCHTRRGQARLGTQALMMIGCFGLAGLGCAESPNATDQVFAVERAFAKTMSDRDFEAFAGFLADEAVFFDRTRPLRGKDAVKQAWSHFYAEPAAPFSWEPDQVEVLESGTLALSTGPVRDPEGNVIARFQSIWRLEAPGVWRVVFDKGGPPSPGPDDEPEARSIPGGDSAPGKSAREGD